MRGVAMALGLAGAALLGGALAAQPAGDIAGEQRRLASAKIAAEAARQRSAALERQARAERDEAARARTEEAAVAARIQQAEADIAAAEARTAIVERLEGEQRARLAAGQGPIVRLVAALQSLARRPTVLSLVQPGSIDDLVHVRAALGTAMPVVAERTAGIRAELARARQLARAAQLARTSLRDGRGRLEEQRLALARLEAEHRLRSQELGRSALFESDRAIALGEQARDIVDRMEEIGDEAATSAALTTLPGPLPRPAHAGGTPLGGGASAGGTPAYRLPVDGAVVTGLGEISDAGVRSRGITLQPEPDALAVAPADGRVVFARRFRGYGVVVILDHGSGWTSLVSGLAAASVRLGDSVAQGAPIGRAGSSDRTRVTVELRRRGRPMDLAALLR